MVPYLKIIIIEFPQEITKTIATHTKDHCSRYKMKIKINTFLKNRQSYS